MNFCIYTCTAVQSDVRYVLVGVEHLHTTTGVRQRITSADPAESRGGYCLRQFNSVTCHRLVVWVITRQGYNRDGTLVSTLSHRLWRSGATFIGGNFIDLIHDHTKYHPAGSGAVREVRDCCISKVRYVPPHVCDLALSDLLHPHFPARIANAPVFLLLAGDVPENMEVDQEEEKQEEKKRPKPSTREIIGPLYI